MVTEFDLPYPPSVNHYFSYYQGRPVLSKDARTYRHHVRRLAIAKGIKPLMGQLRFALTSHRPMIVVAIVTTCKRLSSMHCSMQVFFGTTRKSFGFCRSSTNLGQAAASECSSTTRLLKRFLLPWRSLSHVAAHPFQSPYRSTSAKSESRCPFR